MKLSFMRFKKLESTPGAAGGTNTASAAAANPAPAAANASAPVTPNAPVFSDPNTPPGSNTDPNLTEPVNVWDNTNNANPNTPAQNPQTPQPVVVQTPPDSEADFAAHVSELHLTQGLDVRGIADNIARGENIEEALSSAFETVATNAYRASILTNNKLMNQRVESAMEEAAQKATGSVRTDLAVSRMEDSLPFVADPNVSPIAKAVLNQFLKKGDDLQTAIQNVSKFFETTSGNISKHFNKNAPQTRRGGNGFIQQDPSQEVDDTDWTKLLGG